MKFQIIVILSQCKYRNENDTVLFTREQEKIRNTTLRIYHLITLVTLDVCRKDVPQFTQEFIKF